MGTASMAGFTCSDKTMLRARCVSSRPFDNKVPLLRGGERAHLTNFRKITYSGVRSVFIQGFSRSQPPQIYRKVFIAAAYDQSGSADLQVQGKIVEGLTDPDNVHEASTWSGERNEPERLDTEPFNSLGNSTEELQRPVEKATESLAEVSKGAIEKEDISQATESNSNQEPPRKGAKIHDFCFGIPYGGFLVGGALVGFLFRRDMVATLFGLLLGGAVLGLSMTSLKVWRQGKSSTPYILGQAALSLILLARQLQVFSLTKIIFPTGFFALISVAMLSFYSYVYASGGNPPPKKLRASAGSQLA